MSEYSDGRSRRERSRRHRGNGRSALRRDDRRTETAREHMDGRDSRAQSIPEKDSTPRRLNRSENRDQRAVSADTRSVTKVIQPVRIQIPEIPMPPPHPTPQCPRCGELIQDVTSALTDKHSGQPVHFDCILKFLQGAEQPGHNERIVYIGQGRFAVVFFENPVDTRHFRIVRVIEWEGREQRPDWRTEITGKYSTVP